MSAPSYRRLPGRGRTLVGTTSLHLGPDHVLQVRSNRISEEYQRFYFQDVQSITVRRAWLFHYTWAAFLIALAAIAASITKGAVWPTGIVFASAIFLWLRGPACKVILNTAVTSVRLASLHRLKTAERVVTTIAQHVEAVQGHVQSVPDDYAWSASSEKPPPLPGSEPTQTLARRGPELFILFAFLVFEALLLGLWLARPSRTLEQAVAVATLIEFLGLVTVLVRQGQQRAPKTLRNLTFIATVRWFVVQGAGTLLAYKTVLIDRSQSTLDPLTIVKGTLSYVTLATLVVMAIVGFWFTLSTPHE